MNHCAECGWLYDDQHIYNVHCPIANAQYAEVESVVRSQLTEVDDEDTRRQIDVGVQAALDQIALARFIEMCRRY